MTLEQAREVLRSVTYKDGWRFELRALDVLGAEAFSLYIGYPARCVDTGGNITVKRECVIPKQLLDYHIERSLLDYLFFEIQQTESHEMKEWFRYNGQHVFPPEHD